MEGPARDADRDGASELQGLGGRDEAVIKYHTFAGDAREERQRLRKAAEAAKGEEASS
jgi:hypothetical protein